MGKGLRGMEKERVGKRKKKKGSGKRRGWKDGM